MFKGFQYLRISSLASIHHYTKSRLLIDPTPPNYQANQVTFSKFILHKHKEHLAITHLESKMGESSHFPVHHLCSTKM
jgi:hypothetical protein